MRVGDRRQAGEFGAFAAPDPRGHVFAHAVDRQDGGPLEWAREEGAGGMTLVVLNRHHP